MQFKDVVAQEAVKQHLVDIVNANRLSHALLFLQQPGSGALPLAVSFAQYMMCEKVNASIAAKNNSGSLFGIEEEVPVRKDSCGECPTCHKNEQMLHPDVHFSYPVIPKKIGDKPKSTDYITEWREFFIQSPYANVYDWLLFINAENKQGNITAEECSDIIRQLSLKSFESGYKILIMWMPEYLGKEGNKLLKLIEEPPPNTLFILVADSEEQILPTILSRTQLVRVPPLEDQDIEEALISRTDTEPAQARLTAAIAQGNYHEALQLLQHSEDDWLSYVRDWMNVTLKENVAAQVKWVDDVARLGREKQKQLIRYYNHLLEQCIRLRILGEQALSLSENELDFAKRLNKVAGVSQQQAIVTELDNAAYFIERNANAKMLFHALTIKMLHIIRDKVVINAS